MPILSVNTGGFAMKANTNYGLLFQKMFGVPIRSRVPKKNQINRNPINRNQINNIQVSQLNSKSVRAQLKAAGVDINSKQYKAVINQMM